MSRGTSVPPTGRRSTSIATAWPARWGRLSVRIFGTPAAERDELAHHLGKALQLTNILRDIDEDAEIGRLYLPKEALSSAGIASEEPAAVAADPRLPAACVPVVARAREHFAEARAIMDRCPRTTVRAARVMDEAYGEIFERTVARGFAAPRERLKVSKGGSCCRCCGTGCFDGRDSWARSFSRLREKVARRSRVG